MRTHRSFLYQEEEMEEMTAIVIIIIVFGSYMGVILYLGRNNKNKDCDPIDFSAISSKPTAQEEYDRVLNQQIQRDIRDNTKK